MTGSRGLVGGPRVVSGEGRPRGLITGPDGQNFFYLGPLFLRSDQFPQGVADRVNGGGCARSSGIHRFLQVVDEAIRNFARASALPTVACAWRITNGGLTASGGVGIGFCIPPRPGVFFDPLLRFGFPPAGEAVRVVVILGLPVWLACWLNDIRAAHRNNRRTSGRTARTR